MRSDYVKQCEKTKNLLSIFFLQKLCETNAFVAVSCFHENFFPFCTLCNFHSFSKIAKHLEHGHIDNEFDLTLGHYVEMCSKLGIIVDFDGTLSPLARTPELAFIPPETKKV